MNPKAEVVTMDRKGLAALIAGIEKLRGGSEPRGRGPLVRSRLFAGRHVPLVQRGITAEGSIIGTTSDR
jgi:hypothetical protein